jgi:Protein of unknown function (DUF3617)
MTGLHAAHLFRRALTALTASAALLAAGSAWAQELPARRAGLWKHTTTGVSDQPMSSQYCVDAASDKKLQMQSAGLRETRDCPAMTIRREGAAYVGESTCSSRGRQTHFKVEIKGDFQSKIVSTTTIKHTPSEGGDASPIVTTGVWSGACPADWKPGDFSMEGSPRMNINELMDVAGALTKGVEKLFGK